MNRGKLYFSIGEEAIIGSLIKEFNLTELEAIEHVIKQKRELAFIHAQKGNHELAEMLLREIGEK